MDEDMALRCGFCRDKVQNENIPTHLCTRDYAHIVVTDDGLFFPRAGDGSIIEALLAEETCSTLVDSTAEVSLIDQSELDSGNISQEEGITSESCIDIDESLITEVRNRPILWDHRLPITQRGKTTVAAQWEQVSVALKGQLSAAEAAKKWRNLKDCFMRCLNEEKKSKVSGAGATKRRKWRWYNLMLFYKDVQRVRSTTSNISSAVPEDSDSDAKRQRKGKNRSSTSDDLLEKIAIVLQEPIAPPVLPTQFQQSAIDKSPDDIDRITDLIANSIRRLPQAKKMPFAMQLLNSAIDQEVSVRIRRDPSFI